MGKVLGIGGVFIKSDNPGRLYEWYEQNLGIPREPGQAFAFSWKGLPESGRDGYGVLSFFPQKSEYFEPSAAPFMMNLCVDRLDELVADLAARGIDVQGPEVYEYGRFAWVMDPDGNRVELWEPPPVSSGDGKSS
jgi:predicted enzyme related to lactoylglutathione lyase